MYEERKTLTLSIRMTESFRKVTSAAAKKDKVTVTEYIRSAVMEKIHRSNKPQDVGAKQGSV
jgi:uncharacterized protein (DUF1778 family)